MILAVVLSIVSVPVLANEPALKSTAKQKAGKATSHARAWAPPTYDDSASRLPANYQGIDQRRFHELFKSRIEAMKKGEFETSDDFVRRTADDEATLAPISTKHLYAFRVNDITPKYDADDGTYEFHDAIGKYSCDAAGLMGRDRSSLVCRLSSVLMVNDKYSGSNAYGASRIVERTRGIDFAIAIQTSSKAIGNTFDYPDNIGSVRLVDKLPMPLDSAKAIKGAIGVLFVGHAAKAAVVTGKATLTEPKIDNPRDVFISTDAMPFDLKRIVYYIIPTGEILAQRVFE